MSEIVSFTNPGEKMDKGKIDQRLTDQDIILLALLSLQNTRSSVIREEKRFLAYSKLIRSDFSIDAKDEVWKFIDESPEFYESIRNKKLVEKLAHQYNFLLPRKLDNEFYQRKY